MVQKAPLHVRSTGRVFVPRWHARQAVGCSKARTMSARVRSASEGTPSETHVVHVRVHAILGQNRKNTQRTGRTHVTTASQEGDFVRTSHGPQTPMAPHILRAGALPWVSCMRLSIRYFMPRSHEAPRQSTGPVRVKPV